MKKISHLSLFGALLLILLTTACGADQGATPTFVLPTFPTEPAISTATGGVDTNATADTPTAITGGLETPTASTTEIISTLATSIVSSPVVGSTPGIPVTGVDIVLVECQFCVDKMAHALLVLPDTATFKITSAPTTTTTTSSASTSPTEPNCTTVEVNNGKQVVLCSGPEMTPITLNICTNGTNCTDFPVDLLPCPLVQAANTAAPNETLPAPGTGAGSPTATVAPPLLVTSTPTP